MISKWSKILALFPLLFLLTACPNPPPAEESCNFVQNSLNRRVSWAKLPVRFYIDDSITLEMYRAIEDAMEVWNQELGYQAFEIICSQTNLQNPVCRTGQLPDPILNGEGRVVADGYNGIYVVDPSYFENGSFKDEQARTSISFRGDFIYEADVLIDGSEEFYFEDSEIRSSERKIQFKSLMVHELGHVLGLGHVEVEGVNSVMHPKLQYGQYRPELYDIDKQSLTCEYQ